MADLLRARHSRHLVKQKSRTHHALREPTALLPSEQHGHVLHRACHIFTITVTLSTGCLVTGVVNDTHATLVKG